MTQVSPTTMQSDPHQQRPKGILKNSSFHDTPHAAIVTSTSPPPEQPISDSPISPPNQDLTLQNTLQNAGHRRNSSQNTRSNVSRRQSSNAGYDGNMLTDNARLKWDEANLYLTEQEKSSTMKIDEPKTPYAKRYEPSEDEDEEELRTLDAQELLVDELDRVREGGRSRQAKDAEIPGLDIGEPEEDVSFAPKDEGGRIERSGSVKGEKSVVVEGEAPDGKGHDGTVRHRDFEEMRKRHYEMAGVKGMLGHSADELMDEDDDAPPPPMPKLNQSVMNGA